MHSIAEWKVSELSYERIALWSLYVCVASWKKFGFRVFQGFYHNCLFDNLVSEKKEIIVLEKSRRKRLEFQLHSEICTI